MFELRNSGENRRKLSEIFFETLPRAYKDLIQVKKKFKIISCLCTFKHRVHLYKMSGLERSGIKRSGDEKSGLVGSGDKSPEYIMSGIQKVQNTKGPEYKRSGY